MLCFSRARNALRIAAENKVAKLKEADHIIQSEKRYEQLRFEKMKDPWTDACMQPSTDINAEGYREEPFQPGMEAMARGRQRGGHGRG